MPSTGLSAIPRIELRPLLNATAIWQDLPKICNNNQERGPRKGRRAILCKLFNPMHVMFCGHCGFGLFLVIQFLSNHFESRICSSLSMIILTSWLWKYFFEPHRQTCISSPLTSTFWKEVTLKSKDGSTRGVLTFMLCTCLLPIPTPSYHAALEVKRW